MAQPPHSSASATSTNAAIPINISLMARFKPAKVFSHAETGEGSGTSPVKKPASPTNPATVNYITGVSFDDRGETLVTAGDDETFRLYNVKTGKYVKTFYSKKYGVDLPRFTHRATTILYASTKEDDTIRYHSLHDNKYLQYFRGHKKRVVSLEVSPTDDGFISSSLDNTVRLWDLRTPITRGLLNLPSSSVIAYDTSGVVFAVALNAHQRILLYDTTNFDKAPFLTIKVEDPTLTKISFPPRPLPMTSLSFSSSGKYILVGTCGHAHYIMDAYDGSMLARLVGHGQGLDPKVPLHSQPITSRSASGEECTWSPDSKFVLSGAEDGKIYIWDLSKVDLKAPLPGRDPDSINPSTVLDGHSGMSRVVRFNPRFAMLASASNDLAFWLPGGDEKDLDRDGDTNMRTT